MKYPLHSETLQDTFLFWLTRYLKFKTITLNNSKANKQELQKALKKLQIVPNNFDELKKIALEINKAGIGVYTLFYPAWLFSKDVSGGSYPDIEKITDIDNETLIEWLSVTTSSKSQATKRNYKVSLQDFFHYITKQNSDNYFFDIDLSVWQKNIKNSLNKPPAFLTKKEIDIFISNLDNLKIYKKNSKQINEYNSIMYRLAFKLAIVGGLRVSEIINLKLDDYKIDEVQNAIIVYIKESKANKSREVPIPYSQLKYGIQKELDNYLSIRPKTKLKNLFITQKEKKLSRASLDKVLRDYLKSIGIIKEKMGMHLLRHTQATLFYSNTKDIVLLQDRLGHSDPQTTRRYVHLEEDKVKNSLNAFN